MKLSMRSDYGARAMIELARHYGEGPVQSADIAARQGVPEAYLEQLLTMLRKTGLVRSIRGPRGGHELARHPSQIRFSDVIRSMEGSFSALDCLDDANACQVASSCGMREVWLEVAEATQRILDSVTIEELADRQRAREAREMYYI